ncbi:MAG: hypothetical protein ACM3P0_11125 [Acidobacteriota bacterium]
MLSEGKIYRHQGIRWLCQTITECAAKLVALDKIGDKKPEPLFVSCNAEISEDKTKKRGK